MRKSVVKVLAFLVCACLAVACAWNVLRFKYGDGIADADLMHAQQDDTIDLLVLGSSHAFENINTETLWDDRGIASFVYGGSVQPPWDTYYYLQDALKHQHPKVIVIDVYRAVESRDYVDSSRQAKNTLGLNWEYRVGAIKASVPESNQLDYLLQYPLWHSRYESLARADFTADYDRANFWDNKGFLANGTVGAFAVPDLSAATGASPMAEKTEYWLRRTIELAKSTGAKVVLVNSPYPNITVAEQQVFNTVARLAEEEGLPYLDGNLHLNEIGLDYASDFASDGHLNWRGCVKYTRWLESNIDLSSLPDRRGDNVYQSWERMAADIRARTAGSEAAAQPILAARLAQISQSESFDESIYNVFVIPSSIKDDPNLRKVTTACAQTLGMRNSEVPSNTVVVTKGSEVVYTCQMGDEKAVWKTGLWPDVVTVTTSSQSDYDQSVKNETSIGAGVTVEIGSAHLQAPDHCLTSIAYDAYTRTILWANSYSPSNAYQSAAELG